MAARVRKKTKVWQRRVHPKLRMMLNGDPLVNASRAEVAGCVAVKASLARGARPLASGEAAADVSRKAASVKKLAKSRKRADVKVSVFVQTTEPMKLPGRRAQRDNFGVIQIPLDRVEALAKNPRVSFIEQAENLKLPGPIKLSTKVGEGPQRAASIVDRTKIHDDGEGVLIGVIDVEGFDWLHPDFADRQSRSRFEVIWDQGRRDGKPPTGFRYGTEITPAAMDKARKDAPKIGVSPHDLEPQSEMIPGSHGTHVASIAAGNSGVCKKAAIAAVLVSMPPADRRTSFYDSTQLLDAVKFLIERAGKRPVSINISLGTNGHAHDGSSVLDRWLDALLTEPERSICVAAGNAGQEREDKPDDLGYILGRIHTGGRIRARGLDHDIEWIVAGDGIIDVSENELELWYESQDRLAISIKPPGQNWIGPIEPGEYVENLQLHDRSILSVYNELYHPANGHNYISIYLSPYIGKTTVVGVSAGTWTVRLHGREIRDGRFHGWIERDDPLSLEEGQHFWPSYFSARSNVDSCSVSSLACGARIVSVANLDELNQRINTSSSQGPTRDGRLKPDIAARGTNVLAANGFAPRNQPWIFMTGTSMATPYVTGVTGLMLAAQRKRTAAGQPRLTAAQINGILKATAQPLPGGTYEWANDCGFGVINAGACIDHAARAQDRVDLKRRFK